MLTEGKGLKRAHQGLISQRGIGKEVLVKTFISCNFQLKSVKKTSNQYFFDYDKIF